MKQNEIQLSILHFRLPVFNSSSRKKKKSKKKLTSKLYQTLFIFASSRPKHTEFPLTNVHHRGPLVTDNSVT